MDKPTAEQSVLQIKMRRTHFLLFLPIQKYLFSANIYLST